MNTPRLAAALLLSLIACKRRGIDPPEPPRPVDAAAVARAVTPPVVADAAVVAPVVADAAVAAAPDVPTVADGALAAAPTEPGQAPEPLTAGRHRCSFEEGGHDYDRRCEVTAQPDGSLVVEARGTRLNREQGFRFTATGAPPRYRAQGTLTAFATCSGAFTGELVQEGGGRRATYVIRWGSGCVITIRA